MSAERRVIGWITLSIDGFSAGPDGDLNWLVEHAVDEDAAGGVALHYCRGSRRTQQ